MKDFRRKEGIFFHDDEVLTRSLLSLLRRVVPVVTTETVYGKLRLFIQKGGRRLLQDLERRGGGKDIRNNSLAER